MGAVCRDLAGEGKPNPVARLEDKRSLPPRFGLVLAQPEQLRGNVEGRRQVTGPAMDRRIAEDLPHPGRLGGSAVIAIDEPRSDGTMCRINDDDGRALTGQADGMNAPAPAQPAGEVGKRPERGRSPVAGVLLGPARPGAACGIRAPDLEATVAFEVERCRSRA